MADSMDFGPNRCLLTVAQWISKTRLDPELKEALRATLRMAQAKPTDLEGGTQDGASPLVPSPPTSAPEGRDMASLDLSQAADIALEWREVVAKQAQTARVWWGQLMATIHDPTSSPGDRGYLSGKAANAFEQMWLALEFPEIAAKWRWRLPTDEFGLMSVLRRAEAAEAALSSLTPALGESSRDEPKRTYVLDSPPTHPDWKAMIAASEPKNPHPEGSEVGGKYRKRPVVIDAWRFLGCDKWRDVPDWITEVERVHGRPLVGEVGREADLEDEAGCLKIHTLEGIHRAQPGDWIIRGVQGELYPCKPDIFAQTYEPLPSPPENTPVIRDEGREDEP